MKFKFNLRHSLLLITLVPAILTQAQVSDRTYDLINVQCPSAKDFGKFLIEKQASMTAYYQKESNRDFTMYNITSGNNTMTTWLTKVNSKTAFIVINSCNKQVVLPTSELNLEFERKIIIPKKNIMECQYEIQSKNLKIVLASYS